MASSIKLKNANGKTLTLENSDTNTVDKKISYSSTIPTTVGEIGDISFHSEPIAGGNIGWVYTSSGWKTFGAITA